MSSSGESLNYKTIPSFLVTLVNASYNPTAHVLLLWTLSHFWKGGFTPILHLQVKDQSQPLSCLFPTCWRLCVPCPPSWKPNSRKVGMTNATRRDPRCFSWPSKFAQLQNWTTWALQGSYWGKKAALLFNVWQRKGKANKLFLILVPCTEVRPDFFYYYWTIIRCLLLLAKTSKTINKQGSRALEFQERAL